MALRQPVAPGQIIGPRNRRKVWTMFTLPNGTGIPMELIKPVLVVAVYECLITAGGTERWNLLVMNARYFGNAWIIV